jgi:hypothetical protein
VGSGKHWFDLVLPLAMRRSYGSPHHMSRRPSLSREPSASGAHALADAREITKGRRAEASQRASVSTEHVQYVEPAVPHAATDEQPRRPRRASLRLRLRGPAPALDHGDDATSAVRFTAGSHARAVRTRQIAHISRAWHDIDRPQLALFMS